MTYFANQILKLITRWFERAQARYIHLQRHLYTFGWLSFGTNYIYIKFLIRIVLSFLLFSFYKKTFSCNVKNIVHCASLAKHLMCQAVNLCKTLSSLKIKCNPSPVVNWWGNIEALCLWLHVAQNYWWYWKLISLKAFPDFFKFQSKLEESIKRQFLVLYRFYCTKCGKVNTLRPRQNGGHFAGDIFKCIFLNENVWISIYISPNFVELTIVQLWFR